MENHYNCDDRKNLQVWLNPPSGWIVDGSDSFVRQA
jgi:hypothetical protein